MVIIHSMSRTCCTLLHAVAVATYYPTWPLKQGKEGYKNLQPFGYKPAHCPSRKHSILQHLILENKSYHGDCHGNCQMKNFHFSDDLGSHNWDVAGLRRLWKFNRSNWTYAAVHRNELEQYNDNSVVVIVHDRSRERFRSLPGLPVTSGAVGRVGHENRTELLGTRCTP